MFRRRAEVKEAGCRMQAARLVVSSSRRALSKDSRPLCDIHGHQTNGSRVLMNVIED